MDTLDLIIDQHYLSATTPLINDHMDWSTVLETYKEEYLSLCRPPSKEFAEYEKQLHARIGQTDGSCILDPWAQPLNAWAYHHLLSIYLQGSNKASITSKFILLRENLAKFARCCPEEVENLLGIGDDIFHRYVIYSLDKCPQHALSLESISYLETYCDRLIQGKKIETASDKEALKKVLQVVMNAIMRHTASDEQIEWVTDLVKKTRLDPIFRETIVTRFVAQIQDLHSLNSEAVLNCFDRLIPFDVESSLITIALGHAHLLHDYPVPQFFISYFEKLLDRLDTQDLAARVIADALAACWGSFCFQTEGYANRILDKLGYLPTRLVEAIFEHYAQNQTRFESLVIDILAEDRALPTALLSKLIPVVPKIRAPKPALFIALRLVQHQITLPDETLVQLSAWLSDGALAIRTMTIALYHTLGKLPETVSVDSINALIGMLSGLSIVQYKQVCSILESSQLGSTERTAFVQKKELIVWQNRIVMHTDQAVYRILRQQALEYAEMLEFSALSAARLLSDIQRLVEELGWSAGLLLSLLKESDPEEMLKIISALEMLSDYQIYPESIDRNGVLAEGLLTFLDTASLLDRLRRIIQDSRFHATKSVASLVSEIEVRNAGNPRIQALIKEHYFTDQLKKIDDLMGKQEKWGKSEFEQWRQNLTTIDDSNLGQIIAVLSEAAHQTVLNGKFYPRPIQLIAVLFLLKCPEGGLTQIATGEGKSLIIALLASIKALQGRQVDIVTSSNVLAVRDALDYQGFYNLVGISVSHNIIGYPGYRDNPYTLDIVYGDALHFIGDTLRDLSEDVKSGRGFDLVIVDEVDNLFIDQSNMKVQLSSGMPGFELLNPFLVYLWGTTTALAGQLEEHNRTCYLALHNSSDSLRNLTQLNLDELEANNGSLLVPLNQTCQQLLETRAGSYVREELLGLHKLREDRLVIIPRHLEKFGTEQVDRWVYSLFSSYMYREKQGYIIYESPDKQGARDAFATITPVDYGNTGSIQKGLQWTDGLHQFLQIKHSLTMYPESVTSIFMSYLGFFSKYKGNIFGVTGTLGAQAHHEFLKQVYGVELSVLPGFVEKDLTEFSPILTDDQAAWYLSILDVLNRKIAHQRAALIILSTIESVEILETFLKRMEYNGTLYTFRIGLPEEAQRIKKALMPGDIIISTHLAGRGMDLKLSRAVIKNGGLHVIVGSFSDSIRVQEQAYGRAARQGEPGSAQFIINTQDLLHFECTQEIDCIKTERAKKETEKLQHMLWCDISYMQVHDELFDTYVELTKEANSPTGYNLVVGNWTSAPPPLCLHLYAEEGDLFLKVIDENSKEQSRFNLTLELEQIDPIIHKHIKTVLAEAHPASSSLNQQDYELLHFIAAHHNFTLYREIYQRIQDELTRAGEQQLEMHINPSEEDTRQIYLKLLLEHDPHYKDIKKQANLTESDGLNKVKTRKLYTLWLEDRKTYNNEYELRQISEYWGQWLKNQNDLFDAESNCQSHDEVQRSDSQKAQHKVKAALSKRFREEFKQWIMEQKNQGTLMQNPGYLVLKAWRYLDIYHRQKQRGTLLEGFSHSSETSGFFSASRTVYIKGNWKIWSKVLNLLKDTAIWIGEALLGIVNSRLNFKGENYKVNYPLSQAIAFLNNATERDAIHSWTADNAMSYIRLVKDGSGLRKLEQAEIAHEVKQQYCEDTLKAIDKIREWVIPSLEAQLSFLIAVSNLDLQSDLGIQFIGTMEIYRLILEAMYKNIETTGQTSGKEMIQIERAVSLEEVTRALNITESILSVLNRSSNVNVAGRTNLFNLSRPLNFSSKPFILNQIAGSGGILFEISVYELEEEKNWFGVVMVIGIGIACIFGGLALIGMSGNLFAQTLGLSLMMGGIGDLIQAGLAIAEGRPIDFNEYINAKGMSIGVSIAAAGLVSFLGPMVGLTAAPIEFTNLQLLSIGLSAQLAALAATAVFYEVGKNMLDPEATKADAQHAIDGILAALKKEVDRIASVDKFNHDHHFQRKIKAQIQTIVRRYQSRFHDDKTQFGVGIATSVIGHMTGRMANMVNTVTRTTMGMVKYREALGKITKEVRDAIQTVFRSLPQSAELMHRSLQKSFGVDTASQLLSAVYASGQISGNEIDYQHCERLNAVVLSESLKSYQSAIVKACEKLKTLFEQDHADMHTLLRSYFVEQSTGMIDQIQKQEVVKSIASGLGAEVGSFVGQKLGERIATGVRTGEFGGRFSKNKQAPFAEQAKPASQSEGESHAKKTSIEVEKESGASTEREERSNTKDAPKHESDAEQKKSAPVPVNQKQPEKAVKPSSRYQRQKPDLESIYKKTGIDGNIEDRGGEYTVRSGDNLSKIAKLKGTTVKALQEANGIKNPDQIRPGQILKMPVKAPIVNPITARPDIPTKESLQPTKAPNIDVGSKHDQPIHHQQPGPQKPTIELVVRDVNWTGKKFQHSFTIFTDSKSQKTIITGHPDTNMLTGNLEVIDASYMADNKDLLKGDWNEKYQNAKNHELRFNVIKREILNNDHELHTQLSKAREVVKYIQEGNKGGRFDYDLCTIEKCFGGNSNTLQRYIHDSMGYKIEIPKDILLPGINGEFYDGPLDDLARKLGEQMQDQL